MDTEIIWKGHDNRIDLLLKADGEAVSLVNVTKITLTFGDVLITDSAPTVAPIIWSGATLDTGEVRLELGAQTIPAGKYDAPIIVYDATNTLGIVWEKIPIRVYDEVEASP